jgi:predicted ATPase
VRAALDTGDVVFSAGNYEGAVVARAERLLTAAHPGQTLCSETFKALASGNPGTPARFEELGVFRLSGGDPLRVFQMDAGDGPSRSFPRLGLDSARGSRIPSPSRYGRFFGRADELADLRTRLTGRGERLVTITGPGGNGKTRLALRTADDLMDHYRRAVWFVELADLRDPMRLMDAIRGEIGLAATYHMSPMEQVASYLSDQPSLLVLDNFEHLVEDCALKIGELLDRAPTVQCLVTSRRLLHLVGEHELALEPLPTPNGVNTADRLGMFESVQLFIDRIQERRSDFHITDNNAPYVAEICDRLDGIPLAIELAAAWGLTPDKMLARMENRIDFLRIKNKNRGRELRHETMLACIRISYDLLDPELQRFFSRLCAFRGGWTVEAAEGVMDEPLARKYLTELRESSMVRAEPAGDGTRYRILETLLNFASQACSPEDRDKTAARHAAYYLDLAERAVPEYERADQTAWFTRMRREHDNLRAATEWTGEHQQYERHVRFAIAHHPLQYVDGYWAEAQRRLEAALTAVENVLEIRRRGLRAAVQYSLGCLVHEQGDFSFADKLLLESLEIRRDLGDRSGIADCLNKLGANAIQDGRIDAAASYLAELPALLAPDDHLRHARMNTNLGILSGRRNEPDLKWQFTEQALAQFRLAGDRHGQAVSMINLGCQAINAGEWRSAESYALQAVTLLHSLSEVSKLPIALNNLGYTAVMQNDYSTGAVLLYHARRIGQRLGSRDTHFAVESLHEFAEIVGPERYAALEAEAKEASWESLLGLKEYAGY